MQMNSRRRCYPLGAVAVLLALFSLWSVPAIAGGDDRPADAVQGTVRELLYVLTELGDPSREAQRTWELEQTLRRHFDYEEMARRSLGEAWDGLRGAERRQFVRLFVQTLRDDLADRLKNSRSGHVARVADGTEQHQADVTVVLAGTDGETSLQFRLEEGSAGWRIGDLSIDGASLVDQYQVQFAHILKEATVADLMERMKQRTLLVHRLERVGS